MSHSCHIHITHTHSLSVNMPHTGVSCRAFNFERITEVRTISLPLQPHHQDTVYTHACTLSYTAHTLSLSLACLWHNISNDLICRTINCCNIRHECKGGHENGVDWRDWTSVSGAIRYKRETLLGARCTVLYERLWTPFDLTSFLHYFVIKCDLIFITSIVKDSVLKHKSNSYI